MSKKDKKTTALVFSYLPMADIETWQKAALNNKEHKKESLATMIAESLQKAPTTRGVIYALDEDDDGNTCIMAVTVIDKGATELCDHMEAWSEKQVSDRFGWIITDIPNLSGENPPVIPFKTLYGASKDQGPDNNDQYDGVQNLIKDGPDRAYQFHIIPKPNKSIERWKLQQLIYRNEFVMDDYNYRVICSPITTNLVSRIALNNAIEQYNQDSETPIDPMTDDIPLKVSFANIGDITDKSGTDGKLQVNMDKFVEFATNAKFFVLNRVTEGLSDLELIIGN